jgi:hypothetical protein
MNTRETGDTLLSLVDEVFKPTKKQREVKAAFWHSWKQGPSSGTPTLAAAIQITGCQALETWAKSPKFNEYFFNDQEHGQRLEALFDRGLDVLEEIMLSSDRAADRLKAFEYIAKLSDKISKPEKEVKYIDKDVQSMDSQELEALIKKMLPEGK